MTISVTKRTRRRACGARASGRVVRALCLGAALALPGAAACAAPSDGDGVAMSGATRGLLQQMLDERQFGAAMETLAAPGGWGSLGPEPEGRVHSLDARAPERVVELEIPDSVRGDGSADDPYVGAISRFLERFDYAPISLPAYEGMVDLAPLRDYGEGLSYEPTIVRIPPGHYREPVSEFGRPYRQQGTLRAGLDVPPRVWLWAEDGVVVDAGAQIPEKGALVFLNIGAGLVNFELDGKAGEHFTPKPRLRFSAVIAAHGATAAFNRIHDFTVMGICAAGSRGREGSRVQAVGNVIERIGWSGISAQSGWLVRDNQIRNAGVLRPHGGGGDDGIIIRWGIETKVINNLVLLEQNPHGRHVISGQVCDNNLVAGNVSIAIGPTRLNIGFSDGSHQNRFIGNAVLATGKPYRGSKIQAGIHVNGNGSVIRNNAVLGTTRAFRPYGSNSDKPGRVIDNYAEFSWPHANRSPGAFHRAKNYESKGNKIRQLDSPLPRPEAEKFGFFLRGGGRAPAPPPTGERGLEASMKGGE